jgi:hypothetical protein
MKLDERTMKTTTCNYKITHHAELDVQYLLWVKNENNVWIHDSWHRTEKNAIQAGERTVTQVTE